MKTKKLIDCFKNQKIDLITNVRGGGPTGSTNSSTANEDPKTLSITCHNDRTGAHVTYLDGAQPAASFWQ